LGLSAGTIITKETKEPNNRVLLASWGLYCLVVLFLLFYIICASVPREGTLCLSQLQWNLLVRTKCMAEFSYTDLCTIVMSLALLMLRRAPWLVLSESLKCWWITIYYYFINKQVRHLLNSSWTLQQLGNSISTLVTNGPKLNKLHSVRPNLTRHNIHVSF